MTDFTRKLLGMKMRDDLKCGFNRKIDIMKKNLDT